MLKKYGLDEFECPMISGIKTQSYFMPDIEGSEKKIWTAFKIKKCVESEEVYCEDEPEIEASIQNINIEIFFLNANFNFKDRLNPIAFFADYSLSE